MTNKNLLLRKAKDILNKRKLLVHYDQGKPLILSCNASPYGLTAVLSHQIHMVVKNQQLVPLVFFQGLK